MRSFSHMGNLYKNDARSRRTRRNSSAVSAPSSLSSVFSCVAEDGGLFSCAGGQQKDQDLEKDGDINILDLISTPTKD
ncbi:hypothetical protein TrRE_jg4951 [Triparma retinervis]|uniref:Uncharacterized protein n=1 Tax=Triparma retinervis TaxID=2557542 RepID=A0A9W7ARN8_9STRA|nr:hypothetical protein TrRE_jg4951 [Triparma retinervis]